MTFSRLIATFFGAGLAPKAPGTFGSLAALPAGWLVFHFTGLNGFYIALIAVFFIGWWATAAATRGMDDHDPGEIVIDEVAGQWIALAPVFVGATHAGADALALWPGWVVAFVGFRLFDIWKPGPVGWADRRGDALGVMLDDVFAGIIAAICVMIGAGISHGVFGV